MAIVHFSEVDLKALPLAEKPGKVDNVLVVPFEPVIRIQTDLLTATSPLCTRGEDGGTEVLPSMTAKASGSFLTFLRDFEKAVLESGKANSAKWWPRRKVEPGLEPGVIENGLKSYFKSSDVFKIRVDTSAETLVYDLNERPIDPDKLSAGERFWATLEAHRVVIGRSEFGLVWTLDQAMHKPTTACVVRAQQQKRRPADAETTEFV